MDFHIALSSCNPIIHTRGAKGLHLVLLISVGATRLFLGSLASSFAISSLSRFTGDTGGGAAKLVTPLASGVMGGVGDAIGGTAPEYVADAATVGTWPSVGIGLLTIVIEEEFAKEAMVAIEEPEFVRVGLTGLCPCPGDGEGR